VGLAAPAEKAIENENEKEKKLQGHCPKRGDGIVGRHECDDYAKWLWSLGAHWLWCRIV